ncbi:NADP-dependent phosphogluconate dehydrogenase [Trueperella sp. LYQ141]|uniref:NADP-dependent phosphogluconate dehydrogenase n=1 Tax=Trueperella sp. LYQ141 TaxID=3391058 RepID=UPI003983270C
MDTSVQHIVLMGVCGSGKTTVAGILSDRLGWQIAEADDFHPQANVEKMASGTPLTDEDRWPWLECLREWMNERAAAGEPAIITCSALKRSYRDILRQAHAHVMFVHLDGPRELLAQRMAARTDHFMPPALLDSQLATLEPLADNEDGYVIDIGPTPSEIATEIMNTLPLGDEEEPTREPARDIEPVADIAVYGLGVMGTSLARNFARHGLTVAVYNVEHDVTQAFMEKYCDEGHFVPTFSENELAAVLKTPRVAALMVTAGAVTDLVIDQLSSVFDRGDIIIDHGNSFFADTRRREARLREIGMHFVGCGTSGGEEGALHGPSLMVGGSEEAYRRLEPMLTAIAAQAPDGSPCCAHVGSDGAGHFVKMVHNGIEYADMQIIAESYALLRSAGMEPAQIGQVFEQWNDGELSSYLVDITAQILQHTDERTGKAFVDIVCDQAGQKGTGAWTSQQAIELGVPATGICDATFARMISGNIDHRQAVQNALGQPSDQPVTDHQALVDDVRRAMLAAKIVAYAQGIDVIRAAAQTYGWHIDIARVAEIWRAGCIIRAAFLDDVAQAYRDNPQLYTLVVAPHFTRALTQGMESWQRVLTHAVDVAVPMPVLSSTWHYLQALRTPTLSTSLIQGQRDFFGAHTYRRVDDSGVFHTLWAQDGREEVRRS